MSWQLVWFQQDVWSWLVAWSSTPSGFVALMLFSLDGGRSNYEQVTQLILHRDEAGESKRFAFVTYADKESTNACLEKLDGLEVAGKALAVRL